MNVLESDTERPAQRGSRTLMLFLVAWGTVAALLLGTVLRPPGPGGDAVAIELARDEAGFAAAFAKGWREDRETWCGVGARYAPDGGYFGTLRCHLFVDGIGLVPAYVGLLVLFTMLLSRSRCRPLVVHLLCVPAVAAGLFDIAENGMTVVAAEEHIKGLLADATVGDVRLASLFKWSLVALSFAVVALLAWRAAGPVRAAGAISWPLRLAAVAAALCAIAMAAGVVSSAYSALAPAMIPAVIALALLAWWRARMFPEVANLFATPPP